MNLVTAEEMRQIDRTAIEEFGIPSELLMFTAGKEAADIISSETSTEKSFTVFCGQGNNGGDGFVIAWLLFLQGYEVKIYFNGIPEKLSADSAKFYNICLSLQIEFIPEASADSEVVIDALLGTGFSGRMREKESALIDIINSCPAFVYSIDMPSGLAADGPSCTDVKCVKADRTLTVGLAKINLLTTPGKFFSGKVSVMKNIFPRELLDLYSKRKISEGHAGACIRKKNIETNKYREGCVHIAAGSPGMEGAALLCASALFETGCGIAKLFCPAVSRGIIAGKVPELLTASSADISVESLDSDGRYDILLGGCGAGRNEESEKLFKIFLTRVQKGIYRKFIADGDWLYFLSEMENFHFERNCRVILTPHDGEGARLLGMNTSEFISNRVFNAERISRKYGAVTLLKGHDTVVTDGYSSLIINAGNESLATAGTGDVLAGIVASCFIMTEDPIEAASAAVFLHGKCAEILTGERLNKTIKASDLTGVIRKAAEMI